jgi:hypothetical protein
MEKEIGLTVTAMPGAARDTAAARLADPEGQEIVISVVMPCLDEEKTR